jgi:hypothetical protein
MQIQPRTDKAEFRAKVLCGESVTAQEVFDVAVEGVILQGGPSIEQEVVDGVTVEGQDYVCRYRSKNGRECGIGQVWPDELYHEDTLEGHTIEVLLQEAQRVPASLSPHDTLLLNIQAAHDGLTSSRLTSDEDFIRGFKHKARWLANFYGLTVPPLAADPHGASADAR